MNSKGKSYNEIRSMLGKVRHNVLINEEQEKSKEEKKDGVPYTNQDELYKYSIESTRQQFGADYSKSTTPMIYDPNDGDVILSGIIPSLGNAPFHYRYAEENGCYIWLDGLALTNDVITRLNRILGVYKNWRAEIEKAGDRKPLSYQNEDN